MQAGLAQHETRRGTPASNASMMSACRSECALMSGWVPPGDRSHSLSEDLHVAGSGKPFIPVAEPRGPGRTPRNQGVRTTRLPHGLGLGRQRHLLQAPGLLRRRRGRRGCRVPALRPLPPAEVPALVGGRGGSHERDSDRPRPARRGSSRPSTCSQPLLRARCSSACDGGQWLVRASARAETAAG